MVVMVVVVVVEALDGELGTGTGTTAAVALNTLLSFSATTAR